MDHYWDGSVLVTRKAASTVTVTISIITFCMCQLSSIFTCWVGWCAAHTRKISIKRNSCVKHCLWKGRFTEVAIKTHEAQGTTVTIIGPLLSVMQYFISTALRTKRQYICVANAISYPVKMVLLQPPAFSYWKLGWKFSLQATTFYYVASSKRYGLSERE